MANQTPDIAAEQAALLEALPPALKIELLQHTHGDLVQTLAFFHQKSWNFIWAALPLLAPLRLARYEILFRPGDLPSHCKMPLKLRLFLTGRECGSFISHWSSIPFICSWSDCR